MNGQLPPIDPELRLQLTRRSAGRVPDGLLTEVLTAVDSAPMARTDARWPQAIWRAPRLALASLGVALVAILAVAIAWPAFRTGPSAPIAGYPTDRALTTAELASLLAGPPMPANTTLVASVTIDSRQDVCPMNRYPTVGVIEGMGSQVCVMGATLQARFSGANASGTFAFRYLGERTLGLLGEITPASSSKVAFHVTDDWPLGGQAFLVDAWLGATELTVACLQPLIANDVLDPYGEDCPYDDWLGDESTAPGIQADHEYDPSSPRPSYDPLSLRGNARHVEAGGMRLIDSLDQAAPVHGVYVVRSVTEQCPGAAPQDNRGCGAWRVLARVADISLPQPNPTLTATPTPTTGPPATPIAEPSGPLAPAPTGLLGSGNRPLTEGEFAALWAADPAHLAGRIAIVKGPVPTGFECWSAGAADAAVPSPACHIAILDGQIAADGHYWAVRIGADGKLAVVGEVSVLQSGFVLQLDQVSQGSRLLVVDAWLDWRPSLECDMPPYPSNSPCGAGGVTSLLTSAPLTPPDATGAFWVQVGAYQIYGSEDLKARPIHGLYLLRTCTPVARGATCESQVLARLEAAPGP